jgi:hypothetical protein
LIFDDWSTSFSLCLSPSVYVSTSLNGSNSTHQARKFRVNPLVVEFAYPVVRGLAADADADEDDDEETDFSVDIFL